jgi:AcrR family transcriptional regulator
MPRITEQQRQVRRHQILDAARRLFTVNGFHATSMDDIIAAAGMSSGGVYRYFPGKDAIVTAIAQDVVGALTATVSDLLDEDPVPQLADALCRLVVNVDATADESGRLVMLVWVEAQRDPAIARLAASSARTLRSAVLELVRHAHAAGQLPQYADLEALGQVVFSLLQGYLVQKRVIGDVDPARYTDALNALLRTG